MWTRNLPDEYKSDEVAESRSEARIHRAPSYLTQPRRVRRDLVLREPVRAFGRIPVTEDQDQQGRLNIDSVH